MFFVAQNLIFSFPLSGQFGAVEEDPIADEVKAEVLCIKRSIFFFCLALLVISLSLCYI